MLIDATCSRYGWTLEYVNSSITIPQLYLLLDGWNANNIDGYGIEWVDTRPPQPDYEKDPRGAVEWELRYQMGITDPQQLAECVEISLAKGKRPS